jgi:spore coat protein U-like protein
MKGVLFLAAFILVLGAAPAHALLCIPLVGCSCTVTASDIAFDAFSPLDGEQQASGVLEVDCTGVADVAPSVIARLDDGLYGSMAARQMRTTGGQQLPYNIYTGSALNAPVWGDLTGGAANTTISGGLISIGHWTTSREMFGRAYPTTATTPGGYSDTVVVTIIW